MKKKKRKDKQKLTKKQIIILIVVTIILGSICYYATTEITKYIIDRKTMKEKLENEDFSSLIKPDTIGNISLEELIDNYNELSDDDINISDIVDDSIIINSIMINFYYQDDNISIISINFNKKTSLVKTTIENMIRASNDEISEDTCDLIYDKVFETLGNTEDENSKTSEFFQYKGLEISLKKYNDNDYKYSLRIGRIIEEEETEETEEE